MKQLYQSLRSVAERHGSDLAISFMDAQVGVTEYTFGHLFERAEEIGASLRRRYSDISAPLGILVRSQEAQVLHYLASLSVGIVPAILTPPNPKLNRKYYLETMATVLEQSSFGVVVSDLEDMEFPTSAVRPFTFDKMPSSNDSEPPPGSPIDASFVQFSSGTTGIKKGVVIDDGSVLRQLDAYSKAIELTSEDCIVSWLPLYHDMGFIACLNMPLYRGVRTVMIDPIDWVSDPVRYLRAVSEYRGTLSWHPNFAFSFMAARVKEQDVSQLDLTTLRGLVNCSEPVTFESQQAFAERFEPAGLSGDVFMGCYAMAETTFALTHGTSSSDQYIDDIGPTRSSNGTTGRRYVSVGTPLPGVQLSIRSADGGVELGDREIGEVWARSPFNLTEYFNDPVATADAIVDGNYRTGDLGYLVGDELYVVGRLKDVLVVGGVNVFPQDIEDLSTQVEGIIPGRASAFSAFDDKAQTERVTLLAESDLSDPQARMNATIEIRQRILAALQIANFQVHLVEPGWLIKSTSGKMARTLNQEKWQREVGMVQNHPREAKETRTLRSNS